MGKNITAMPHHFKIQGLHPHDHHHQDPLTLHTCHNGSHHQAAHCAALFSLRCATCKSHQNSHCIPKKHPNLHCNTHTPSASQHLPLSAEARLPSASQYAHSIRQPASLPPTADTHHLPANACTPSASQRSHHHLCQRLPSASQRLSSAS